jgi:hypothetical protein
MMIDELMLILNIRLGSFASVQVCLVGFENNLIILHLLSRENRHRGAHPQF